MNLVQINERLKDMPLQAVQQYANGMNPEIPPYLALGELQRRETMHKQMATAQGAAAGPQPSVKEQIEQKAGLMALQMQQAKQAQQQMSQPRMGPVPENVPQPTPQPEPEMAMAHGGIARLPVRPGMFDFASGGIIAFQEGGDVELEKKLADAIRRRMKQRTDMTPESMAVTDFDFLNIPEMKKSDLYQKALERVAAERQKNEAAPAPAPAVEQPTPRSAREPYTGPQQYTLQQQGADWVKRKLAAQEEEKKKPKEPSEYMRQMGEVGKFLGGAGLNAIKHMLNYPGTGLSSWKENAEQKEQAASAAYPDESKRGTAAGLPALPGAPSASPAPRPPAAPRPPVANVAQQSAPAAPAAPSAAADSGILGLNDPAFLDAAKRAIAEPNQQQAITDYEARKRAMGLADPYGKEQEARINALNAQYQQGLENRGLERLMRVLQARNMGEYGSRYLGSVEQERAADLAHAAKMNELLGTIESKRREEGMGGVKTIGEELDRRRQLAGQTASSLSGSQMQAGVSRANQLSQNQTSLQIAQLDRQLREKLHSTPAAQIPSVEREMLDVYTKQFGGDRAKAYEHLKTLLQENKAELSQPQLIRKYVEDWNKLDPVSRMNYEKQGIKNVDDYVAYLMKTTSRLTGGGKSTDLPPGFKLDK